MIDHAGWLDAAVVERLGDWWPLWSDSGACRRVVRPYFAVATTERLLLIQALHPLVDRIS